MSDLECLRRYVQDQSQEAFAALVSRYVNLVYSAALRQVRSAALAEEVAQSVFLDLGRRAGTLPPDQPLAPWLYVVTRRTAIDVIRREARRAARERTAAELLAMNSPPDNWSRVQDAIDDAMESLTESERAAVVLRYFENCSLREVGASLGISEDTAQKRVSRGLERLRTFLVSRGVAVTAVALATDLSAHAIEAAPSGLGPAISTTAASVLSSTAGPAAFETGKLITMTALKKSALATALAVVTGAGVFEAATLLRWEHGLTQARQENDRLAADLRRTRSERDGAMTRLSSIEQQIDARLAASSATPPAEVAVEAQMREWLARIDRLKERFRTNPNLATPELRLLKQEQWLKVASANPLESDDDMRRALAALRAEAAGDLAAKLSSALGTYVAKHDGMLPDDPRQLAPFFQPPLDPEVLGHFEMLRTGKAADPTTNDRDAALTTKPIDVEYDTMWQIGRMISVGSALDFNLREAQREFAKANGGQRATNAAQLEPYLKWPVPREVLEKHLAGNAAAAR